MTSRCILDFDLPLFKGLTKADLQGVNVAFQEKSFSAWETIFNQEDCSRDVYFLLSGALIAVYWTNDGREIIFSRFTEGSYFGELAALDGGQRSLAVLARKSAKVLVLPPTVFLALFDQVDVIRRRITTDLASRIRRLTAQKLELTVFSVEQRVASYLIGLAMERGCLTAGGVLDDAPTHAEIAASIGANREMVSRIMTRLTRSGIVKSSRQRIELLDPGALSERL